MPFTSPIYEYEDPAVTEFKKKYPERAGTIRRDFEQVDPEQILRLASYNCTVEEMSHILNIPATTLQMRYHDVIEKGRAQCKMSLRRSQLKFAHQGSVPLLVFLGKVILKQNEGADANKAMAEAMRMWLSENESKT